MRTLAQGALSKKVVLDFELPATPLLVGGDENQLLQIFLNLVTNAAEAIGEARGRIVVGAELVQSDGTMGDLAQGAECVRVTVSDTGCGMDAATKARIFDPFFTTKFTGRGLGLAAARGIVARHEGTIEIESVVGEGTTFVVLLPTTAPSASEEPAPAPPAVEAGPLRVLVVDDDAMLRSILTRRLHHHGYAVVEAENGEEALERFEESPDSFDCVLLDLSMPKLSGQEVHRALVELREDVRVVLMSGYTEQQVLDRFDGVRPAGILQKPVPADDLLAAIQDATA